MFMKRKFGMTLVEVILAMAILAIIVVFMTPILVSAFRQIVLNGNRSVVSKSINGDIREVLAGGSVPASLGSDLIYLPGSESVKVNRYEIQATDTLGNVLFNFFIPQEMSMATSPSSPSASIPVATTTGSGPTTTGGPFTTTAAPVPQFPFNAQTIKVSVDNWRVNNKFGYVTLINSASWYNDLKYTLTDKWTSVQTNGFLSGATTNFALPDNTHDYVLSIQNVDDTTNALTVNIGRAPAMGIPPLLAVGGNKYKVQRYCVVHPATEIITANMHHPTVSGSSNFFNYAYSADDGTSSWSNIDNTEIQSNKFPIYVRINNTNTISEQGIMDTNSLPVKVSLP